VNAQGSGIADGTAARRPSPLKFLFPGWYAIVMGLAGLALAWHRADPLLGPMASRTALAIGALASLVFVVLAGATLLRWRRHHDSWLEDLRHPVRHAFVATLPIAVLLLVTVAVALGARHPALALLWWAGSIAQLAVTLWVLARWWRGAQAGGLQWAGVTPALFIPIVGNVLVPLAGVPLGHVEASAAQFGVGLLFWPVVLVLLVARLVVQGPWPERLLPTNFILVAPPAVVALGMLQFGAPLTIAWALWGMALFSLLWAGTLTRRIAALPFGLPHWGMSFPLAAFAALTLRLAEGGAMRLAGLAALALASLVIAALALATLRGLRDGSLLAPEPVAALQPAAS
jgi:tellurite resistance protein